MEVQTAMIDITIECSTIEHSNRTTLHRVYYFGRYSAVIEFRIQSNHSSRQCNAQCSWNPEPFTYVIKPYSIVDNLRIRASLVPGVGGSPMIGGREFRPYQYAERDRGV